MSKTGLLLLAVIAALFLPPRSSPAQDQDVDPSEIFLKAYMTAQLGEKLERENQFKPALSKFRFAGALIEELKKNHADWQPAIVEYRGRKISEAILRVQSKFGTQSDLAAMAETPPEENGPAAAPNTSPSGPQSRNRATTTQASGTFRLRSRTRPRTSAPASTRSRTT